MINKIPRYISYVARFARSHNKAGIVKDLLSEMATKGPVTGIKSMLHKKSHYYFSDIDEDPTNQGQYDPSHIDVREYNRAERVVLPQVAAPLVSIIIPMYNEVEYTYNCIRSIYDHNDLQNYEIIVADDRSPESTDLLKNIENLIVLRNEQNMGFLRNCNNAVQQARGEYIVLLNNDTQVQRDWLAELLYIFEHDDRAGLVGSKLVYPDGTLQEAGGIIWRDGSAANYGNTGNPGRPEYNYVKEVDYISGASIMMPKKLWNEIGGFDERYLPAYCEDSDLCFQVRAKGYKVVYAPCSVVVHFEGVSHGTDLKEGVKKHQVANQKKLYERWKEEIKHKARPGENIFKERDRSQHKKHVLVVDHYLPQVEKDAGSRTIDNFIDVMLELGYSVKFLGENSNTGRHYQKKYQLKGVEVLYGTQFNFALKSWRRYLKAHLNDLDAILLSRSSVCIPILAFLKHHKYKGNIIYYGHDLGFQRLEKEGRLKNDDAMLKLAKKIKADEDFMYTNVTNALGISSEEIAFLRSYIKTPIHYVPPYFFDVATDGLDYAQREGLMFVGGFNHPPNQDAMRWFLDEVYAPLAADGIKLTVAGSKMPAFMYEYQTRFPTLTIRPDVPSDELEDMYRRARIAIVPLLSGAGVKGKVIEAFAKGVPVIGTDTAFEGMPKDAGFIYKGVNTPADTVAEIRRVYNDPAYWQQLSNYGQAYIRNNFARDNMKQVFKKLIG